MNLTLPEIVAEYFAAEKAKDSERLSRCFHPDAVVHDEGHTHRGIPAIQSWHQNANSKYRYVVQPLTASTNGPTTIVQTNVTGDFPGNLVHLNCTFTVSENQITSLKMAP